MPITFEDYNHLCIVACEGPLQAREVRDLSVGLAERFARFATTDVVIDLQHVDFIDSAGLEAMLQTSRQCQQRSGRLKLARLTPAVKKILEITRLEPRFECHDDLPTAMKAMT